ncbi:uncharacterized protein LOC144123070 [Amblyomma americanum]
MWQRTSIPSLRRYPLPTRNYSLKLPPLSRLQIQEQKEIQIYKGKTAHTSRFQATFSVPNISPMAAEEKEAHRVLASGVGTDESSSLLHESGCCGPEGTSVATAFTICGGFPGQVIESEVRRTHGGLLGWPG